MSLHLVWTGLKFTSKFETINAMHSFSKGLIYTRKTEYSRLREHKNKRKVQLGNPKSGRGQYGSGRLRELFITKFTSQFKRGFTNVVVTRAGRLREWSQGELRLYNCTHKRLHIRVVQPRPNIRSHRVLFILYWRKFLRVGSFVLIATQGLIIKANILSTQTKKYRATKKKVF